MLNKAIRTQYQHKSTERIEGGGKGVNLKKDAKTLATRG
jgi:hypothetical protein